MAKDSRHIVLKRYICPGLIVAGLLVAVWIVGDWLGTSHHKKVTSGLEPTAFPGVFVDHRVADMGLVASDQIAEATFTLHNLGQQSYSVKKITASCSCAIVDLTKAPLPARGSLSIPVRMSTSSILTNDSFEKSLLIELSQDHGDPNLKDLFKFQGRIDRSGTFVAWPAVIDCGDTLPGERVSATAYFKADSKLLDQLPSEIEVSGPSYEIKLSPADHCRKLGLKPVHVILTIPSSAPEGPFASSITVKTPVQPARSIQVVLRARITRGIVVSPD
jgi:hypothetical protein